jgi:hypothetical protein
LTPTSVQLVDPDYEPLGRAVLDEVPRRGDFVWLGGALHQVHAVEWSLDRRGPFDKGKARLVLGTPR